MDALHDKYLNRAKQASHILNDVAKTMPLLRSMKWDDHWRIKFLDGGTLPRPIYPKIDTSAVRETVASARALLDGDHAVTEFVRRFTNTLENMTGLIETRGTKDFYKYSKALFGEPNQVLIDGKTRVFDLAKHMDTSLEGLHFDQLVLKGNDKSFGGVEFAKRLRPHLKKYFGEDSPRVEVKKVLSAKALAGRTRIRVRSSAEFGLRDVDQLLQHEALVHVATSLNGATQDNFPFLARAHAGTTEVQEGLAVFAEIMSGAMDPDRFRRLSDRVLGIQMCIEGADFKEVFDFYLPRTNSPDEAYENTRRIFRGGVLSGGTPFTKDMVYLNGLLRVHNYMRSIVKLGRADLIRILWSGKMDIEDVPALAYLAGRGELQAPKYMPPWITDLRFLVSYLAYSSFLNQVKMPGFQNYYERALKEVPIIWDAI